MEYKELKRLIDKYLDGETSVQEETRLRDYIRDHRDIPEDFRFAQEMFGHMQKAREQKYPGRRRRLLRKGIISATVVAASLAIFAGMVYFLKHDAKTSLPTPPETPGIVVVNDHSSVRKVAVSKHTVVWMNRNSEIRYDAGKCQESASIYVKGEIFIEMQEHEKCRFNIMAENALVITEKPASLNIKTGGTKECIEIVVAAGAVKVRERSEPEGLALLVTEGNYCSVHKYQRLVFAAANKNSNYMAWKTGRFVFDRTYLATVTDVLAEYYNVEFRIENQTLAYCELTGSFEVTSMEDVLDQIHTDLNVEFSTRGKIITLTGGNCKH